jgi:hypothetical protein
VLLQTLIAGAAAAGVAFKFYGRRLLVFLRLRKPEPEPESPEARSE